MDIPIITRAEAKAQGLIRYISRPCKHGHDGQRYTSTGKCVFCVFAAVAAAKSRNPDKERERQKQKRLRNPETVKARNKRYSDLNPEKRKASVQKWREANPEQWRESNRQSKARYKDNYNAKQKEEYHLDPDKWTARNRASYARNRAKMIERATIQWRTRRAQAKGSSGPHHTAAEAKAILVAQNHRCIYCRADLRRKKRHLDHVVPLSAGGSNDKTNLQWLCAPCNLSKGARDPISFAQGLGLLL